MYNSHLARTSIAVMLMLSLVACGSQATAPAAHLGTGGTTAQPNSASGTGGTAQVDTSAVPAPDSASSEASDATRPATILWQRDISVSKNITVAGDLIYFFTPSGKLRAVDRHSGEDRWSAEAFTGALAPTVADGLVIFRQPSENDHVVVAADAATGTVRWTANLKNERSDTQPQITLLNGIVYLVSNGSSKTSNIYALDQQTGQMIWSGVSNNPPILTPDQIYIAESQLMRDQIIALDGKTGDKRWSIEQVDGVPLSKAVDQLLYSGCLTAIDLSKAQVLWKAPFEYRAAKCANLIVVDDLVVVEVSEYFGLPKEQEGLYALDRQTGAVRWRSSIEERENGAYLSGPPILIGQTLYMVTSKGVVTALDTATGALRWKMNIEYAIGNDDPDFFVTADQQTLIVGNSHGPDIIGFDLQTGARHWTAHNTVDASFVKIDSDVYMVSQDQLIALSLIGAPPLISAPPDSSGGLDHASLTITAVAECSPQSDQTCRRQPMEALFVIKQGEKIAVPMVEVRTSSEPISLPPGVYIVEATDPLNDPSVSAPEPQTVTLRAGESATVSFSFEQR